MHPSLLAAVVFAAVTLAGCTADGGGFERVARVEDLARDTVIFLPEHRIYLVQPAPHGLVLPSPIALRAWSPHRPDEQILYCSAGTVFVGEHGEVFDIEGRYLLGPFTGTGLERIAITSDGGWILIDPEVVLETPSEDGDLAPEDMRQLSSCLDSPSEGAPGFVEQFPP